MSRSGLSSSGLSSSGLSRSAFRVAAVAAAAALALGLSACQTTGEDGSDYATPGKLTIATGDPAYYPYVIDDEPQSGEGFEAAVAYAVAEQLGFAAEDVVWVRSSFEDAIAPGPKDYDFNLQQVSILADRIDNVDFSSPYYAAPQAIITVAGSAAEGATTIAALKELLIGAATGTSSFSTIEDVIQPTQTAAVFNTNDEAVLALQNNQVDAIVVDLPTAFYLTGVELENGLLLGQFPAEGEGEEWGLVLEKDSPLTDEVSAAVDALAADGTLDALAAEWLSDSVGVPVLQ